MRPACPALCFDFSTECYSSRGRKGVSV